MNLDTTRTVRGGRARLDPERTARACAAARRRHGLVRFAAGAGIGALVFSLP